MLFNPAAQSLPTLPGSPRSTVTFMRHLVSIPAHSSTRPEPHSLAPLILSPRAISCCCAPHRLCHRLQRAAAPACTAYRPRHCPCMPNLKATKCAFINAILPLPLNFVLFIIF
jgi:hypothetical protein